MCQALGHVTCISLWDVQGTLLLLAPLYNLNSGSGMPCDTPKETQLAAGRARIQTQAEWCTHHPQRSGSGMHWGDGDGVAFVLTATLGLTLQVPHGSVGVSVGGGTGVWQSQVRKAQSMLRSPRRGQAVALTALCVSSHPGAQLPASPASSGADSRPLSWCMTLCLGARHFY